MLKQSIAILGECMVEETAHTAQCCGIGGDTMNTAIYLSRLQPAYHVAYFSALGKDDGSVTILSVGNAEGVDMSTVFIDEQKQAGRYQIHLDDGGERSFTYQRHDSAARHWLDNMDEASLVAQLSQYDYVYLSGITLAIQFSRNIKKLFDVLSQVKAQGCRICFDSNYRPSLWQNVEETRSIYQTMLTLTDIALLTFDDEQALFGDASPQETLSRVQQWGVSEVVIKCGKEACLIADHEGVQFVPAILVDQVIDTTSAGDSFNAGYLAARMNALSLVQSAQLGHTIASKVIQHHGAIIPRDVMSDLYPLDLKLQMR